MPWIVIVGFLRYTVPPNGSIISFFKFFYYGKMLICSMYIIWKKILRWQPYIKRLDFIYYNNIILYISNNTHILPIPPMSITHTTLQKIGDTELISTIRCLHIDHFLLRTSFFRRVV
jgi:hypothetical protein